MGNGRTWWLTNGGDPNHLLVLGRSSKQDASHLTMRNIPNTGPLQKMGVCLIPVLRDYIMCFPQTISTNLWSFGYFFSISLQWQRRAFGGKMSEWKVSKWWAFSTNFCRTRPEIGPLSKALEIWRSPGTTLATQHFQSLNEARMLHIFTLEIDQLLTLCPQKNSSGGIKKGSNTFTYEFCDK